VVAKHSHETARLLTYLGALLIALVSFAGVFVAGCTEEAGEPVYEVLLSIETQGQVLSKPRVVLDRKSQANLILRSNDGASQDLMLTLAVPSEFDHNGKAAANVRLALQREHGTKWEVIAAEEIVALMGKSASTEFQGIDVDYNISFAVGRVGFDEGEAKTNGAIAATSDECGSAPALLASSAVDDGSQALGGGACCTVRCTPYYLTCCNVVSCCDDVCNRCCKPQ
jgi:hypothetical protein